MAITNPFAQMLFTAVDPAVAPLTEGTRISMRIGGALDVGTSDQQVDVGAHKKYTIGASGTQSVDLSALTDSYGTAITLAEGGWLVFKVGSNTGGVKVSPNSTNGYTGFLASASHDLDLGPGGAAAIYIPDNFGAVSASDKVIDIVNQDGSNSVDVELLVFGRSA